MTPLRTVLFRGFSLIALAEVSFKNVGLGLGIFLEQHNDFNYNNMLVL